MIENLSPTGKTRKDILIATLFLAPVPCVLIGMSAFMLFIILQLPISGIIKYPISFAGWIMPQLAGCSFLFAILYGRTWKSLGIEQKKIFLRRVLIQSVFFFFSMPIIPLVLFFSGGGAHHGVEADIGPGIVGFFLASLVAMGMPSFWVLLLNLSLKKVKEEDPYHGPICVLSASWLAQIYLIFLLQPVLLYVYRGPDMANGMYIQASPDNSHCVIGEEKGTITVRRIAFPHQSLSCKLQECQVYDGIKRICYSPDGKIIAAGLWSGSVVLMDASSLTRLGSIKDVAPKDFAFFQDSKNMLVISDKGNSINKINLSNWKKETIVDFGPTNQFKALGPIAVAPDGKSCFVFRQYYKLCQYNLFSNTLAKEIIKENVFCDITDLAFQNNYLLVFGTEQNKIIFVNTQEGQIVNTMENSGFKAIPIYGTSLLLQVQPRGYKLINISERNTIVEKEFRRFNHPIDSITITPNGKKILYIDRGSGSVETDEVQ